MFFVGIMNFQKWFDEDLVFLIKLWRRCWAIFGYFFQKLGELFPIFWSHWLKLSPDYATGYPKIFSTP
jgi:hypothetical protein